MSAYLILLGLTVALFLINIALVYRNRAEQEKHKAEIQKTVADAVQATVQHRQQLDDSLETVEKHHREETIIERAHLADRRDFDNDWGGLPVELTGNNAASRGAAATDSTGIAGD
jgi:hypothetical protein